MVLSQISTDQRLLSVTTPSYQHASILVMGPRPNDWRKAGRTRLNIQRNMMCRKRYRKRACMVHLSHPPCNINQKQLNTVKSQGSGQRQLTTALIFRTINEKLSTTGLKRRTRIYEGSISAKHRQVSTSKHACKHTSLESRGDKIDNWQT